MSGPSTADQRRFLAALCKIAWADGRIEAEEREHIHALIRRFDPEALDAEELDEWLESGVPESEVEELPEALGQLFAYEALKLAESDGDLDEREMALLEGVTARLYSAPEDKSTPLAKIALRKVRPS